MSRYSLVAAFFVLFSVSYPAFSHESPYREFESPVNAASGASASSPRGFADSADRIHAAYIDGDDSLYTSSPSPGSSFSAGELVGSPAWNPGISVSGDYVFVSHTYRNGNYFPRLFRKAGAGFVQVFDGQDAGALYVGAGVPVYSDIITSGNSACIIADGGINWDIYVWDSADGVSFDPTPTQISSTAGSRYPALAASGSSVYAAWVGGGDVRFNRSTDNGASWGGDDVRISSTGGVESRRPGIAAEGDWVFIVWSAGDDVYFSYSGDRGEAFSEPAKLAASPAVQKEPSISASPGPRLGAAWTEIRDGRPRIVFHEAVRTAGGFAWGIDMNADGVISGDELGRTLPVSMGAEGEEGAPSAAMSPSGAVYVLWRDSSSGIWSARYSPDGVFPGEPAPPSGLSANPGDSSVSLSWTGSVSPDVVSYRIYRAAERGRWSSIAELEAGVNVYSESGLVNGVIYWYAVKAVDREGISSLYSNHVSTTPQPGGADTTPPGAPSGLEAYPEGDAVFLAWSANGEPDLRKYHVYSRTDSRNSWQYVGAVDAPDTQFFHLNLTPGVSYQYVVTAIDSSNNESADSPPVYANPGGGGSSGSGSGCFIATAAYGSAMSGEVLALSAFRDEVLLGSRAGRAFVSGYYSVSPVFAEMLQKNSAAKAIIRLHLFPLIRIINAMS